MRKAYVIRELQEILGVSRTAIVKKIKSDDDNPVIRRYKNRYEVVDRYVHEKISELKQVFAR